MKIGSWEHYELSYPRVFVIAVTLASAVAVALYLVTYESIGQVSGTFAVVTGVGFAYLVLSEPKRAIEKAAVAQAREAPSLAAAATIHLQTTGSRNRGVLLLKAEEGELARYLRSVKRHLLLGVDTARATQEAKLRVASSSALRVIESISGSPHQKLEDEGRELETLFSASSLGEETKMPVFIAITFFAPIMLILFAAISHNTGILTIISLLLVQVVILDLAFSFSSAERRRLSE